MLSCTQQITTNYQESSFSTGHIEAPLLPDTSQERYKIPWAEDVKFCRENCANLLGVCYTSKKGFLAQGVLYYSMVKSTLRILKAPRVACSLTWRLLFSVWDWLSAVCSVKY